MSWRGQPGQPPWQPLNHPNLQYPPQHPPPNMNSGYHNPLQAGYGQYAPPQGSQYPPQAGAPHGSFPPAGFPPAGFPPQSHSPFHQNQTAFYQNQGHSPQPPHQPPYPPPGPPSGPPPGQYGGYQQSMGNPQVDAQGLHAAMKGLGTRETELIRILAHVPNDAYMQQVHQAYKALYGSDLVRDIESETSNHFRIALVAVARGPLAQDCQMLYDATHRLGTKESTLNDILLGRSNSAMRDLTQAYERMFHRYLDADIRDDLSFKTQELFIMVLKAQRAEEYAPADPHVIQEDVRRLGSAMGGKTQQTQVCEIFAHRSDGQLRAISERWRQQHSTTLAKAIEKAFSGHMEEALLRMLACAEDRAKADADALEQTMKGWGTEDNKLISRLVRIHWNKEHLGQVKGAYRHFYRRELVDRIRGETSGDYRDMLVALCI